MGRRSSYGGGGRSYSTGRYTFRTPSSLKKSSPKPPAKHEKEKAPPAKVEDNNGGSWFQRFTQTMSDGFGFGIGNSFGHRFMGAIFGHPTIKHEIVVPEKADTTVAAITGNDDNDKFKDYSESCNISYNAFQDCLNVEGNNLSKCHVFMDSLFECRQNSTSYNL